MGGCNCFRKPRPPPNFRMIGQWILNEKSRKFHIGSGKFRYKKGTNLLGVGLIGTQNNDSVCRLIIHEDGMITFYQYTSECWMVIDGPVYSWKNGKINAYEHSRLDYDTTQLENKGLLIVNGMRLHQASSSYATCATQVT